VVHCKSGGRAAAVVSALMEKGGFDNVYNLRGGITAWVTEIDNGIEIG
jgi:adenylyltransferase/sulfurtransferase